MPLPLGEVAEHSEDGEGNQYKALSVTCGDSSPRGRAKDLRLFTWDADIETERVGTDTLLDFVGTGVPDGPSCNDKKRPTREGGPFCM